MRPVGQALASAPRNGFGSADEYYTENQPKAAGQGISATGQLVGIAGVTAVNATINTSLTGVRAAASALNGTGMVLTGVGERWKKDIWKAGSNFVGAAHHGDFERGVLALQVDAETQIRAMPAFFARIAAGGIRP